MDTIVVAGGIPGPDEPLYPYTKGDFKARVEIAGRPLIQWILDALSASGKVNQVVVVGLEADPAFSCTKPCVFLPNQGEMLDNIRVATEKVVELNPDAELVLSVSGDIPAITGEMVDWIVDEAMATEHDLYYSVIPRQVMESRFPESHRSYVRLKDGEYCGGDVNVFRSALLHSDSDIWARIIAARKSALKQAALLGLDTLFLLLFRRMTIDGAVRHISERLGVRGRALVSPYAEIGMDVDKPHQLENLKAYLASRTA